MNTAIQIFFIGCFLVVLWIGGRLLWLIHIDEYRAKKDSLPPTPPAPDDPYDIGVRAGRAGVDFWRNPHAPKLGSQNSYSRWSAGWCYGKQLNADL